MDRGQGQLLLTFFKFTNQFRVVRVMTRLIDRVAAAAP
jgi:hypothetical protein